MYCVAEAGSVRAFQWLRRAGSIHGHPLAGPGCLVESKHQKAHSKRLFVARLEGQSAWAPIYPIAYDEARNRIHPRNGRRKWFTGSLKRSLGITLHSTRVDYVLCGNGFYSLSNIESNKSKCCPSLPGAWVPTNAATHAEPLYQVSRILENCGRSRSQGGRQPAAASSYGWKVVVSNHTYDHFLCVCVS